MGSNLSLNYNCVHLVFPKSLRHVSHHQTFISWFSQVLNLANVVRMYGKAILQTIQFEITIVASEIVQNSLTNRLQHSANI